MPPHQRKLRQFSQPADLKGHKYAGPVALTGGRIPSWKNAPFIGTAASGTQNRSRERVQAQADRIQIMKAHYVRSKKMLQDQQAKAKAIDQKATNLRRNAQTARALAKGSLQQANRDKYAQKLVMLHTQEQNTREDKIEVARMIKMYAKELDKINREITKITQRLSRNKAMVKKRK